MILAMKSYSYKDGDDGDGDGDDGDDDNNEDDDDEDNDDDIPALVHHQVVVFINHNDSKDSITNSTNKYSTTNLSPTNDSTEKIKKISERNAKNRSDLNNQVLSKPLRRSSNHYRKNTKEIQCTTSSSINESNRDNDSNEPQRNSLRKNARSSNFSTNNTNKNTVGGSRSNSSSWSISNDSYLQDVLLVEELDIMQIPVLIKDFTLQRYKSTIKSPKIFYPIQRSAKLNILNELYNDENILNNLDNVG
ncbi:hypothetical protein Glove_233g41 [Diversispora epigaea]|uniref:Uncharacterized protein n=1 Tax=Diversispora epigaea TaxID=1348612 RepID=A0A397IDS8_9GLOM|nr:hypothetical protein Glove_233g41 [Diversispora epigaea]